MKKMRMTTTAKKILNKASTAAQILTLLASLALAVTGAYTLLIEVAGLGLIGWSALALVFGMSLYGVIEIVKRSI